jgi:NAD(P)H-hydrate epimerase
LSRDEVRSIDTRAAKELGLPTLVLMENAGRSAAEWLRTELPTGGRVLVLCGPGNNGGDGGVVARHLDAWGYTVNVIWFADPSHLSSDAAAQRTILARSGVGQAEDPNAANIGQLAGLIRSVHWIVDALLGTGLTRPVEGPLLTVIEALNQSGKPVLALDLPSGLDADTGTPLGVAVRARTTVTFVAPKVGFARPSARDYTGAVQTVDIGVPRMLLEPFRVQ